MSQIEFTPTIEKAARDWVAAREAGATVVGALLAELDRRGALIEKLQQRTVDAELCVHWVDGRNGERITVPERSCPHCLG